MNELKKECRSCRFYVIGAGGPWRGLCKKCGAHQTHDREACGQYRQAPPELIAANAEFEKRHAEEIQKIDDFVKGRVVRTNLESVTGLAKCLLFILALAIGCGMLAYGTSAEVWNAGEVQIREVER